MGQGVKRLVVCHAAFDLYAGVLQMNILEQIAADKRVEVEKLKETHPLEKLQGNFPDEKRFDFKQALTDDSSIHIIAELKRGSPSRGVLASDFNPGILAEQYQAGGAVALSVLTEEKYFYGRYEYIQQVKKATSLPVLAKDFIIDPYQIHWARYINADAVLLIVRLLPPKVLAEFLELARRLRLDCLVEVHSKEELQTALDCGADIIGVNNRDLRDFTVKLEISEALAPLIPNDVVKVAESGIFTYADVARLKAAGYTNFLVGEALVTADDPVKLLRSLQGV
jgi:indole-3-glycerol phosphate synthase